MFINVGAGLVPALFFRGNHKGLPLQLMAQKILCLALLTPIFEFSIFPNTNYGNAMSDFPFTTNIES
jgi:hypothetical protein